MTDIAGTTRDTVNQRFTKFGMDFVLLDTAGLRKKVKVHEDLEFYSNMRTLRTIEDSDVCMLVIDAAHGLEAQDLAITSVIHKNRKGLIVVVNKWDLVEKQTQTLEEYKAVIKKRLQPFNDVPIVFTSALTKQRVLKAIEEAMEVYRRRSTRISKTDLNDRLLSMVKYQPPPHLQGQGNQDQVHYAASDEVPAVCVFLQPASVRQRQLLAFCREPDAPDVRLERGSD